MSKGTRVYSLRIPPELMAQVYAFVARNLDRDKKGDLTVTKFINDAIRERLGKLERAKRCGRKQRAIAEGGVIHPPADGPSLPVSSLAGTGLSDGAGHTAGDGR